MFLQNNFYSPALGRFIQPDTIVPNLYNPQSLNRYSYVYNSPLNYTDPSGHNPACGPDGIFCGGGNWVNPRYPDKVDGSKLSKKSNNTPYSGEMMYGLYIEAWLEQMTSTSTHLTIKQFAITILSYEFQPYGSDNGFLYIDLNYINDLKTAGSIWFWCSTKNCTNTPNDDGASNENILNWIGAMESARSRYDSLVDGTGIISELFNEDGFMSLANEIGNYIFNGSSPYSTGKMYRDLPSTWGNGYMFGDSMLMVIDVASIGGYGYKSVWNKFDKGPRAAYILTNCQVAYFSGKGDLSACP